MERFLFWAVFLCAYTLQAITGFAGNIIAMPAGVATIGMSSSVAVLNIMGVLACGAIAWQGRHCIDWHEFGKMISVMTVFLFVGIWLDTILSVRILMKILGTVVLLVGLRNLLVKKESNYPEPLLWVVLALAGLMQGMFVSGGAFLVIYALQKLPDKLKFRSTLSLIWTVLNALYAVISAFQGHATVNELSIVAVCIPIAIAATVAGTFIERRISQKKFLTLTYILLVAIGVILLVS